MISGINLGANMGDDTIYSGTVAAATEGYLLGIPSIAISLASKAGDAFRDRAQPSRSSWSQRHARAARRARLLNVNVPDVPRATLKGYRITRLGRRHKAEDVDRDDRTRAARPCTGSAPRAPRPTRAKAPTSTRSSAGTRRSRRCRSTSRTATRWRAVADWLERRRRAIARSGRSDDGDIGERMSGIGMTSTRTRRGWSSGCASRASATRSCSAAMNAVPRHIFVDEALAIRAYDDSAAADRSAARRSRSRGSSRG